MTSPPPPVERCAWCGAALQFVWVHGHGQCAACGINCDPCCGGAATCGNVAAPPLVDGVPQYAATAIEKGS